MNGSLRIKKSVATSSLRPLFAATRVLQPSLLEAERLKAEAAEELARARNDAQEIRTKALVEAKALVDAAEHRAQVLEEAAFELGRDSANLRFDQLLEASRAALEGLEAEAPKTACRLAFQLVTAVLKTEFEIKPELVLTLVEKTLDAARRYRSINIHVHPSDALVVNARLDALRSRAPQSTEFRVVVDATLALHDVVIKTEMGRLDGSLSTWIRRFRSKLREAARESP